MDGKSISGKRKIIKNLNIYLIAQRIQDNINYMISNGRFFAFGCSFTEYIWPTWADILGREFEYYKNCGRVDAGMTVGFYQRFIYKEK